MKLHPKYKPLFNSDSRYFIVTGGRGSGKSYGVSTAVLLATFEKENNVLYSRYTMTSASTSIIPEMAEKIKKLGLDGHFTVNSREIINRTTGNTIYFRGLKTGSGNQTAALKSLNNIGTFVLDEAEEMPDEALFDKIDLSVRSQVAKNRVIMVMNPATKAHWIYGRFFESQGLSGGENVTSEDTTYIHTTFLDNAIHLPESFKSTMERMRVQRPSEYDHIVMGGWRETAEGVIFRNWEYGEFTKVGDYHGYGVDYGFSNDENTITEVCINKNAKTIHLKEHLYKTGLTTSEIAQKMLKTDAKGLYVADSAEPRLNHELKHNYKLNIKETIKGQGSVNLGISLLLDYKLIVDPSSKNIAKELNNYIWKDDKEVPVDKFNHAIDGIRYIVSYFLSNPNAGSYFVS
jgi:phage terminase large subunit